MFFPPTAGPLLTVKGRASAALLRAFFLCLLGIPPDVPADPFEIIDYFLPASHGEPSVSLFLFFVFFFL